MIVELWASSSSPLPWCNRQKPDAFSVQKQVTSKDERSYTKQARATTTAAAAATAYHIGGCQIAMYNVDSGP